MKQRLRRWFIIIWGVGIVGLAASSVLYFFIYRDYALPERLLLSLSPSNTWFHPAFYEPAHQDLLALIAASDAADLIAQDRPIHLILNSVTNSLAEYEERDRIKIARYWLYPHRVQPICEITTPEAVAAVCGPITPDSVLIGWGFADVPNYRCVSNARRYFVCSPS